MPQITDNERPKLTYRNAKFSIIRIVVGFIKKMCIADQVAIIAAEVFANYANYHGIAIVIGVLCFAIQLYADFSGYMDIVVGIGSLMGLNIPENFKQPFFSKDISEFWRKWHITLGNWLKDYVFYPILKSNLFLAMSKAISSKTKSKFLKDIPLYLGMVILWTLIGLWHGAGFNYVFGVGILQFIYIFTETTTKPLTDKIKKFLHINENKLYWKIVQGLKCTALMCFAWIFFRAATFSDALNITGNIFSGANLFSASSLFSAISSMYGGREVVLVSHIIISVAFLLTIDIVHERGICINEKIASFAYPVRLLIYLCLVFAIILLGAYGSQYLANNFIYFNF